MMESLGVHGLPFLACLVMLAILSYIGIHVLKREIIFIDIALAQIAAVGAVAAHVVFRLHGDSITAHALAFGATFLAAGFFALVRRAVVQIPLEAVIGVSYAVSAAAALFLIGVAPGGHVHVQGMLAGSVLWATWTDVLWSALAFAAVGMCFRIFQEPFRAISEDYGAAVAAGYNTVAWDFFFYALVGIVVTVAVRTAGVVLVFTFLIIPATLSAVFTAGWRGRLYIAWGAGAVASFLGLSFAGRYDYSVGPAIALFLGEALIVVGLLRLARVAKTMAGVLWLVTAVALGLWFTAGPADDGARSPGTAGVEEARAYGDESVAGDRSAEGGAGGRTITHPHHEDSGNHGMAEDERREITAQELADVTRVETLRDLYAIAGDSEEKGIIVCRWLEVDLHSGVRAAIEFLRGDPPLLFRSTVVAKLSQVMECPVPYEIEKPFDSPANRDAVTVIEGALAAPQK